MKKIYIACFVLLLNLSGCATNHISQSDAQYDKRAIKKFSEFNRFFIKSLTIDSSLKSEYNNQQAFGIIDENLYKNLLSVFNTLDAYSEFDSSRPEKTLIIVPEIVKMKSVGSGSRALLGVLAGASAVVLKTTYIDAETNDIIATPSFYQHAGAWAARFNSRADMQMLDRITKLATQYAIDNY
jgi:hypothetical protein